MKKLVETFRNIWAIQELRDKITLTFGLILVYRLGSNVVLPGIDPTSLDQLQNQASEGLVGLINAFSGGAFANASVLALGIMPYISASIFMQLAGLAIPAISKMQKEGESGRRKLNQITRYLTILVVAAQAPGYITNLMYQGVEITLPTGAFWFSAWITLISGTIFAMWLGEKITDKGIGNGISLLIMVGIIANMPQSFVQEFISRTSTTSGGLMFVLIEVILWFLVILGSVLLVMATRQIPVQYARRTASGGFDKNAVGTRQYIPLKLNASGVMPIIFAQAIMFAPGLLGKTFNNTALGQWMEVQFQDIFGLAYNILFALLIIIFTYFYTAITVPTNKMADDLKRSGGFIPGVLPGKETGDFLDKIMSLITLPGSIFLALLAILPALAVKLVDIQPGWALFYGGTSLLIMVGVAIDTVQQVNAYLLNRHYDGLMKSGKNRKEV